LTFFGEIGDQWDVLMWNQPKREIKIFWLLVWRDWWSMGCFNVEPTENRI